MKYKIYKSVIHSINHICLAYMERKPVVDTAHDDVMSWISLCITGPLSGESDEFPSQRTTNEFTFFVVNLNKWWTNSGDASDLRHRNLTAHLSLVSFLPW